METDWPQFRRISFLSRRLANARPAEERGIFKIPISSWTSVAVPEEIQRDLRRRGAISRFVKTIAVAAGAAEERRSNREGRFLDERRTWNMRLTNFGQRFLAIPVPRLAFSWETSNFFAEIRFRETRKRTEISSEEN